jgi:hypothetical protein
LNNSSNLFSLLSSSQIGSGTLIDGDWPRPETVTIDLVGSAATNHQEQQLNSDNETTIDLVLVSVIPYMSLGNNNTVTSATITHHRHPLSNRAVAATCLPRVEKRTKLHFNKLETHSFGIFSGNGRLTLPNTTKTIINITSNGSAIVFYEGIIQGKETIRTEDSETSTFNFMKLPSLVQGKARAL